MAVGLEDAHLLGYAWEPHCYPKVVAGKVDVVAGVDVDEAACGDGEDAIVGAGGLDAADMDPFRLLGEVS